MNNITSPFLTSMLNNNISFGNNAQNPQQVGTSVGLKQDTFTKSGANVAGITATGVIGGGVIGGIKECINYINSNPQIQPNKNLPINSIVAKFLNREALSNAESALLQKLKFTDAVFAELSPELIGKIKKLCNQDLLLTPDKLGLINGKGALKLGSTLEEKTIARMTGKCSADENIFKLFGDKFEQIYNNVLKSHPELLDEKTGFMKEYVTQSLWTEMNTAQKDSNGIPFIIKKAGDLMPDFKTFESVKSAECKNLGETVAKNFDIKKLLKSAGIGAAIVGALALGGSLIYNKVKKSKQSNQSA